MAQIIQPDWETLGANIERHWGEYPGMVDAVPNKCEFAYPEALPIAIRTQMSAGPVEALNSLDNIEADALSMDYEAPSQEVAKEAKRILCEMHEYSPLPYNVSSMSEGRIGIDVYGGYGRSILLICESGGTALCIVTIDQVSRRARYGDSGFLPDDFVKEGLRQLGNV